ncbi:hypothetical protein Tco_0836501 [Tanacetum coccineum]
MISPRKSHFPTDFVVFDFKADPRVPHILGRSFLRTGRALIDVYGEEITLRVDNEAVTFNLDQTKRYSSTNDKSVNRIDIIDAVCEEYALKLLGFSNSSGGNPTPTSESFTSEFILGEIKAYLKDDSISSEIDLADCDPEEDICLIENLLLNEAYRNSNLCCPDWKIPLKLNVWMQVIFADCLLMLCLSMGSLIVLLSIITLNKKRSSRDTKLVVATYKLVYGKSCHLPIELEHKAYWALKHANFDLKTAGDHRKLQLNELNELRDQAYENSLIYKERTKKLHDSKIKNRIFNVGDRVLLFNSRLKIFSGKLKTRWSGPFTITKVFPYGTIELSQPDGPNFKVNGHRVKHYFGGDLPPKCKRSTKGSDTRNARLAIRVPFIDPTAKINYPMITRNKGTRSKAQGERVRGLEASASSYKYKALLTHIDVKGSS